MADHRPNRSDRYRALNDALQALTYRESKDLAQCLAEAIHAQNGLNIKDEVIAEALDSLGAFLVIELEELEDRCAG